MERKSDEQLLADHLADQAGAFDELVDRYASDLYGFLCRFTGNPTTAEDLIQETFVQVHLAAESFDRKRAFKPWLYTIAANKARDWMRSRGRRQEYSLDRSLGDDETRGTVDTVVGEDVSGRETETETDEQRALVRRIVDEMPDHLRLILVLGYFQQLPYAEIAEILDVPVGTVKSRLHAAVKQFAQLWQSRNRTHDSHARE